MGSINLITRIKNRNKNVLKILFFQIIYLLLCDIFYQMTNRHEELINAFEAKLRKLISEYHSLRAQNQALRAEVKKEHDNLMKAHSEILELRKKNDHLTFASQFGGAVEGRAEAKKQIDKLVREIDQCLALLDE